MKTLLFFADVTGNVNDPVNFTFFIGCMAMMAASAFFFLSLNQFDKKWRTSILVSGLIIVAVISIPIISLPGNDFLGFNLKFFKHALEWDYFLGVISFYLLTFFMWKKS